MRRPSKRQSALRAPLNALLSTEAHIRLLRVLANSNTPLSRSRLASESGLDLSGITRSLAALEEHGIVESVGAGSRRPVRFRVEHPLGPAIQSLFQAEQEVYPLLVRRLTQLATGVAPPPLAIWLEGPVATGADGLQDPVTLGVLADSRDLDSIVDKLEKATADLEQEFDRTIEIGGHTSADLAALPRQALAQLSHAIPLVGPPPLALRRSGKKSSRETTRTGSHSDMDARSRQMAQLVAERLRTDPTLVRRARDYLATRMRNAGPGEQHELKEWDRILRTMSVPRLRRFLIDEGERATRLRQSSPFVGVLVQTSGAKRSRR